MEGGTGWLTCITCMQNIHVTILIALRTMEGGTGWRTMELLKIDFYLFLNLYTVPTEAPRLGP